MGYAGKTQESGAPTRTRTADLLITNQLLYQLSYRGTGALITSRCEVRKTYRFARARSATAQRPTSVMTRAAGAAWVRFSRLAFSCTRVAKVL